MKKLFLLITIFWLALIMVTSASCSSGSKTNPTSSMSSTNTVSVSQNIQDVSVTDAYLLIQTNKSNRDFIIIDVRTPEEYAAGHIEGASLINFYDNNFKDELSPLDRSKTYFIYCRTGHRSGLARDIMKDMGFVYVTNMLGGITDWTVQNYPLVK